MHRVRELLSAEAMLAFGGFCMFIAAPFLYFTWHIKDTENRAEAHPIEITDEFLLGQYYFNQDGDPSGPYDLKKARSYYEAVLEKSPVVYPLAWYQLGRIDFLEGRFVSALHNFDKQVEYFGSNVPNVYYMIGLTNGFKAQLTKDSADWEAAEAGFTKYLELNPESPWARTDLSWVYFSEGKYEDMLPVLEEGLKTHPDHPWLLNMYGLALLNTGRPEDALSAFTHAQSEAAKLTVEDWGNAYPGNDPRVWGEGLDSFREAIKLNVEIAEKKSSYAQ